MRHSASMNYLFHNEVQSTPLNSHIYKMPVRPHKCRHCGKVLRNILGYLQKGIIFVKARCIKKNVAWPKTSRTSLNPYKISHDITIINIARSTGFVSQLPSARICLLQPSVQYYKCRLSTCRGQSKFCSRIVYAFNSIAIPLLCGWKAGVGVGWLMLEA